MANTNFAKQSFQGLPQWAKGIIAIAVVGGVAYLGYKLYDSFSTGALAQRKEGKEEESELKALIKSGNPPKLSKAEVLAKANQLQAAFNGIGTDFNAIIRVFIQVKNYADLLALISVYGVRKINSGIYLVPDFEGTLPQAITKECSPEEVAVINKELGKKGITYRF